MVKQSFFLRFYVTYGEESQRMGTARFEQIVGFKGGESINRSASHWVESTRDSVTSLENFLQMVHAVASEDGYTIREIGMGEYRKPVTFLEQIKRINDEINTIQIQGQGKVIGVIIPDALIHYLDSIVRVPLYQENFLGKGKWELKPVEDSNSAQAHDANA